MTLAALPQLAEVTGLAMSLPRVRSGVTAQGVDATVRACVNIGRAPSKDEQGIAEPDGSARVCELHYCSWKHLFAAHACDQILTLNGRCEM